jgi:peptidoglycan/LPS O-acetylase OafA/YrhL
LDGLRGVASIMVVVFHLFETYTWGDPFAQVINHGYLAVDFFFLLSGFVIAYAYDERWGTMSAWEFYKRRLLRLQPMVVMGSVIGALLFYFQAAPQFPLVAATPLWKLTILMMLGFMLVPVTKSLDVRGWGEMYPLNSPAWSLFFEYLANILYAVGLRKLSNRALGVLVLLAAVFLVQLALTSPRGGLAGGWSFDVMELHVGFARVLFPFFAGVLLMRSGRRIHIKGTFAVCSLLLAVALSIPRFGDPQHLWINGVYEAICVIVVFPVIVAMGAGERLPHGPSIRIARFFGELSYPLYITHYPLIYVYTSWVVRERVPAARGALVGALVFVASIAIAYSCLKIYDLPVRRLLSRRFLPRYPRGLDQSDASRAATSQAAAPGSAVEPMQN